MDWTRVNPKSNFLDLVPEFYDKLCRLEELCGFDLQINCGFRSIKHELAKGRKGTSSHCKGLAVDIRVPDSIVRYILVDNALRLGFPRIGIYKNFVHIDDDRDKVSCMWYE